MKHLALIFLIACAGCTQLATAQARLIDQAERGLELSQAARQERSQLLDQLHHSQRSRLDSAFDEDVRARAELSPDWIIEHRKAYAVAIDMLHRQLAAGREADAVAGRGLAAVGEALQRLRALQEVQSRLASPLWWFGPDQ